MLTAQSGPRLTENKLSTLFQTVTYINEELYAYIVDVDGSQHMKNGYIRASDLRRQCKAQEISLD